MLTEKLPVPVPELALLPPMVGLPTVFQQTPLSVTEYPLSVEMYPPEVAEVWPMFEAAVVLLTTGTPIAVVKEPKVPERLVPLAFVA